MRDIQHLRGLSPFQVALRASLNVSVLQSGTLKVIGRPKLAGEIASCEDALLTKAELAAVREAAGASFLHRVKPRVGEYRSVVIEAGRRSGKTVNVCASCAVSAALALVEHLLAPGEVARVILIAPTLSHLRQLMDAVAGILSAIGVPFARKEREITLGGGLRTIVECAVADHLGPRGGTAILAIIDEAALLPSQEGADGWDEEVVAAVRPALASLKGRLLLVSSPWAKGIGVHSKLIEENHGHFDRDVLALRGPTWKWNPSISEAQTRKEEPDERRWRREYLAEPGNESDAFLDGPSVRALVEKGVEARKPNAITTYKIGVDSAFKRDGFWIVVVHREVRSRLGLPPLDVVVVDAIRRFSPRPGSPLNFDVAMHELVALSHKFGNAMVHYDQHASAAIEAGLRAAGIVGVEEPTSLAEQERQWGALRHRVMVGGLVLLDGPDGEELVKQLVQLRVKLGQRGSYSVGAPERVGSHDDGPDALKLAAWAVKDASPGGGGNVFLGGNDLRRVGGGWERTPSQYYEELPTGEIRPCHAPRGTELWHQEREDRRKLGMFIVGLDEDEDEVSIPRK